MSGRSFEQGSRIRCARCGRLRRATAFAPRPDRPGRRRTTCRDCLNVAQSDRYHATRASPPRPVESPKPCSKCGIVKPVEAFHRDRSARDGRTSRCATCIRRAVNARRKTPIGRAQDHGQRHRRRARAKASPSEQFPEREVYERDKWRCFCGKAIDAALRYPDPMSASLDHVVPLSRGGGHTRANCRAAHLRCNVRRGARLEP